MIEQKQEKRKLWQERMSEYEGSGMSIQEWCKKADCPVSTFKYWRYKAKGYRSEQRATAPSPKTAPVNWLQMQVSTFDAPATQEGMSIRIGAVQIQVASGFDRQLLRQIVETLT